MKYDLPVSYLDDKTSKYDGEIYVGTSIAFKDLEFDAVIRNDVSSDIYDSKNSIDMHLLYVAAIRALHELKVLYSNVIKEALTKRVKNKVKTR